MSTRQQKHDIAAYFWPAYHDEPRWRRFMPEGEGEWQTIRKAKPKFSGHRQPRVPAWGYLNEADPRVIPRPCRAQAQRVSCGWKASARYTRLRAGLINFYLIRGTPSEYCATG
jgi:hypothetical protein